jgi:cell division protein FtsW (lipid II flippase)
MDLHSDYRPARVDLIQSRLLALAGLFLFLYSVCLSLAGAVLERSQTSGYRWNHWLGWAAWVVVFYAVDRETRRRLPDRDPFLLPIAALLTGWGMLTVWRLYPAFGIRQGTWMVLCGLALIIGLRLPADLGYLRRYKYVWLTGGILLTAATLLLGVNPQGYGPRMWLNFLGLYFQPSEPLKLLLIVYLAAYMADSQLLLSLANRIGQQDWKAPLLPLLAPTLIMTGLALAVLAIQRDLGAAAVLLFLYAAIVYVTSGMKRVVAFAGAGLVLASGVGYWAYSLVRVRVDAWLDPWLDPSGKSYQIVQSLLAIANGGILGRGPGLGSPGVVPLAHSDLIFAAIVEETGLLGAAGMLLLLALLVGRGLRVAMKTTDLYQRYLAAGLTAYLAGQSLLIIGGTLRLLPLTGITLPFVSYGGSSLLVSFIALLLLLQISRPAEQVQVRTIPEAREAQPFLQLGALLGLGLLAAALATGWWGIYRSGDLLGRTDNPRRSLSDQYVRRGAILDREDRPVNLTSGEVGSYTRKYQYPSLSNVVGYTNPTYGQSGLESSQDDTLRGLKGNRYLEVWWNRLVYGQPPPGLDIRLSVDLELQRLADKLFRNRQGALVALNARSGEVLVMASYPSFDAGQLDKEWGALVNDRGAPLLNRATLGRYAAGELDSSLFPGGLSGMGVVPTPLFELPSGDLPGEASIQSEASRGYSPLQMALAAAAVSAGGVRPAPQLVMAIHSPQSGWMPLPALSQVKQALSPEQAASIAQQHAVPDQEFWQMTTVAAPQSGKPVTWYVGGTQPGLTGTPYVVALVIEDNASELATQIGQAMLQALQWGKVSGSQ